MFAEAREQSASRRKELASLTKQLKAGDDAFRLGALNKTMKAFQKEVELLTQRAASAEDAYDVLASAGGESRRTQQELALLSACLGELERSARDAAAAQHAAMEAATERATEAAMEAAMEAERARHAQQVAILKETAAETLEMLEHQKEMLSREVEVATAEKTKATADQIKAQDCFFFSHSTHFSHISEPSLPISHLSILFKGTR